MIKMITFKVMNKLMLMKINLTIKMMRIMKKIHF
jgi:hypothetical protein